MANLNVVNSRIDKLTRLASVRDNPLTSQELEIKEKCEGSLASFFEHAWPYMEGCPYVHGFHIDVICEHLEALRNLYIRDLVINVPPRCTKSSILTAFVPWIWTTEPAEQFICATHSEALSNRDSLKSRLLIESEWYQRLWGDKVKIRRDVRNKHIYANTKYGFRQALSVNSKTTGFGANWILCDDPNDASERNSEAELTNVINWWCDTMPTRVSDISLRRRLIMQQRLGTRDLTGYVLSLEESRWVHVRLPMEFEKNNQCVTIPLKSTNGEIWKDPRQHENELLWPQKWPRDEVEHLKISDFNNQASRIAGQFQQRPFVEGGGKIKADWFKKWKGSEMPHFRYILQSWDTAMIGDPTASYTCATTWGVFNDDFLVPNVMLLSVFYDQLDYPDIRKMVKRLGNNYHDVVFKDPMSPSIKNTPHSILIEEKSTGQLLVRDYAMANLPISRFNPTKYGNKDTRCFAVSHFIENGRVWLPTRGPTYEHLTDFSEFFVQCATLFPNPSPKSTSSDTIDTMSQAFIRLRDDGWLYVHEEAPARAETNKQFNTKPYYDF